MSETLPAAQSETAVAVPADDMTGLEDYDATDLSISRMSIDHKNACFVDSVTNEQFSPLKVVMLGLVKQRVLWPADLEDEPSQPLCKSYDHALGVPNVETFPYDVAGIEAGATEIDCGSCPLQEWGSHPKTDAPWCNEQFVVPSMLVIEDDGETNYLPTILTFQRSSLKPARQYLGGFARVRKPLFTVFTTVDLESRKRGTNEYCVPTFKKGAETPDEDHADFVSTYRAMREYLQTPRTQDDASDDSGSAVSTEGEANASANADDDDLPF